MALTATATAQGALSTWDETIVPALRKRLESESRILAKRMSIASISSAEDLQLSPEPPRSLDVPRAPLEPAKLSAIPRPSLQYSRTTDPRTDASSSYTRLNGAPTTPSIPPKRARTYSQPPSPNSFANNPLPNSDYSRPTSPRTSDVKPTRIPIAARARTASASSHAHIIAHRANSRNGANHRPHQTPTPDASQDPWMAKPSEPQPTTPPMASIRHQPSSIINEPPPFSTSLFTPSMRSRKQDPLLPEPRPSNDSEERPFEHWYRGDVHRNGGVGELRVAKHMEMLQIANYGHNLRNAIRGQTHDLSGPVEATRGRKRADSVGAGTHESLYLEDEPARDVAMVLDESPLTDIEDDHDTDAETFYDAYVDADVDADDTIRFSASVARPSLTVASAARSETPTRASLALDGNSAPKQPSLPASGPLRSNTPSASARPSAESTVPTPQPSALRSQSMSSTTSPRSQSSDQSHTKRRAKSPVSSASPAKKAKPKAKTLPLISQDLRNSVAVYPTPEGDMVNAIPTWTQPVQKSGNWDEVVPPVVARKRGLDGLYEQADGSPKPKSPPPVKPAPGTFGYDYTKYRPPRRDEEISMIEFGHIPEHTAIPEKEHVPSHPVTPPKPKPPPLQLEEPIRPNSRKSFPNPPNSPAPFSQYRVDRQVPTINVTRPSTEFVNQRRQEQEDDVIGGCCKCVIM